MLYPLLLAALSICAGSILHYEEYIRPCLPPVMEQYDPEPPAALRNAVPGVDAVFVVHAPGLTMRREALEKELVRVGLNDSVTWVTWFNKDFINGLSKEMRSCLIAKQKWYGVGSLSNGTISLALKHLWVYWQVRRRGYQRAVVMEDDAVFSPKARIIRDLWESAEWAATVPFSLLHFSACSGHHDRPTDKNKRKTAHIWGPGYHSRCTAGYMVSNKGAKALLDNVYGRPGVGIDRPSDHQQNTIGKGSGYWYEPLLWKQSNLGGVSHTKYRRFLGCEKKGAC
mmetsp:Transcript_74104/g.167906  ORF Transcript_74104/g.167906 Transcript_74104/m.167906 type:complete len:283 (+) Transcript_74104:41-889(+)